ncbi:MAG: arsC [Bacteroidota bacterium]|jgi:arsenate reductase|nr:arsC [Bacteroidota bacterium]
MKNSKPSITIYHNTRCSKSRGVCELLEEKKVNTNIIEYLKTPPTQKELKSLLKMLGIKASELVRKNEPLFKEKFEGKKMTQAQWLKALVENPVLIERPILVMGDKAIIARPPELTLEFLKKV